MQTTGENTKARIGYGILAIMVLGTILGGLLQNAVSTVLPAIMAETGVTVGVAQWLVTMFQLCLGIVIPLVAFLVRRFDVKSLFVVSTALFAAGTFLVAAGDSFTLLFVGRFLQGIAAGVSFPLIQVVVFQNYPRNRWGTIMGIIGLAFGFAPNIGPTIAGICADIWGWRSMFWAVAVLSAVTAVLMAVFLPRGLANGEARKLDWPSVVLSTLGFGGVLLSFTNATDAGPLSAACLIPLAVGTLCMVVFLARQRRIDNPLWDLDAFRDRDFTVGTIMVCLLFSAFIGVTLVIPMGMQAVQGFSTLEAGMALLPGTIAALIMNPLSGILMDRIGVRPVICFGSVLLVAGTIPMMQLGEMTDLWLIMALQGVRTFGISSLIQPISTWSVRSLHGRLIPDGTSISNTLRQVAAALGTSVMVLLMSIGGAAGSVSAFGVDVAIAFSAVCSVALLVLSFAFVRK
ncbi:MAG: DHA2 family efflux MFS transporter permease subunit [Coriobacteriia bacterium]|nr:DHA2 family efflux MFS transporter permease subunit [Coriobacteriia bacterium]